MAQVLSVYQTTHRSLLRDLCRRFKSRHLLRGIVSLAVPLYPLYHPQQAAAQQECDPAVAGEHLGEPAKCQCGDRSRTSNRDDSVD